MERYDIVKFIDNEDINYQIGGDENNIFISFSGRDKGNCYDIAHHLMKEDDNYIAFKDISYHSCSKCEYECFNNKCKYRHDDVYTLFETSLTYKNIILLVPMYCANPSSLYFTFNERMQDYFSCNSEKWDEFVSKLKIIAIFGSKKETPLFIPTLLQLVNGDSNKILKIERHKYNINMNDKVIDNKDIIKILDSFVI